MIQIFSDFVQYFGKLKLTNEKAQQPLQGSTEARMAFASIAALPSFAGPASESHQRSPVAPTSGPPSSLGASSKFLQSDRNPWVTWA